jgi:hypothetical protein
MKSDCSHDSGTAEGTRGTWFLLASPASDSVARKVQLTFQYPPKSRDGCVFALDDGQVESRAPEPIANTPFAYQSIRLRISNAEASFSRDSGTFRLLGFDGQRPTGDVLFVASQDFVGRLRASGVELSQREALQLSLAGNDRSRYRAHEIGLPDADIVTMAISGVSGQTGQSVGDLKELIPSMRSTDLKQFLLRNITPAYVRELAQSGLQHLTPADVTRLRDAS